MIRVRLQIEDGVIEDSFRKWGFVYVSGDRRFAPPEKKRDSSSYIEERGSHDDPRTVDDEFDYKVRFLLATPNRNLTNANKRIKAFNDAVRETAGVRGEETETDVKYCREITLYDDYMRCRITGIPDLIETVDEKDFYRRQDGSMMDCVVFELKIHVSDPGKCVFDTDYNP